MTEDIKNVKQSTVIQLKRLVAEGSDRQCWHHPDNPALCIKVQKPGWLRPQNRIEWHYARYLQRRKIKSQYIALPIKMVETNLGVGLVYPLIHDHNGQPSLPLDEALKRKTITPSQARRLIKQTFAWLEKHRVLFADYSLDNMVVQNHGNERYTLVIVDGLGARNFNINYFINLRLPYKAVIKAREFRNKALAAVKCYENIA